ncbi:MAG: S8 family serine peptidase [Tabrizicola sp.]|jgi:hypothetical protein|nr:S8 family serine peptidase [Tabrizicola sp.]
MLSLSSLALLAACGGGGEDGGGLSGYLPDFAAPTLPDSSFLGQGFAGADTVTAQALNALLNSPTYQGTRVNLPFMQSIDPSISTVPFALRASGAAFAHAAGLTGAGQLIAISDEHISPTHVSISGRVTEHSNFAPGDEHGTSVASVAAGNDPGRFIGTAPGANIIFGSWFDADLASLAREALRLRAVAWNNSWGYVDDNRDTLFATETAYRDFLVNNPGGAAYLDALKDYAAYGVVVFAVSNFESDRNSGLMDALPVFENALESGWLAVANGVPTLSGSDVTAVNLISTSCWEAARWCIVADGSWNAAIGSGSEYEFTTGSSFAAPQVAGALALLAEAFPDLSPHELRVRLLAAADDNFAGFSADASVELAEGFFKDYSVVYGHGFLDIEAALRPIGGTALTTARGQKIDTDAPVLTTGSAFGDALEVSLADTEVVVRDALSASFMMPGEALTAGARPASQATALLFDSLTTNLKNERTAEPSALSDPFSEFSAPVSTVVTADGLAKAAVLMPQAGSEMAGVTVTQVLTDGPTKVEVGVKVARDNGSLMSLRSGEGASMASIALGLTQEVGNGGFWALSGEIGITDLGGATALNGSDSARFDAVKLTAGKSGVFTKNDRLSIGVGLPIAIASGETNLDLPVMRQGLSAFESVSVDLAPEDRQVDLELTYQAALSDSLEMKMSVIHSDNFGNRSGLTDTGAALAFSFRF